MAQEKDPEPCRSERENLLEEALLQFAYRTNGGENVDLGAFCEGFPVEIREELRERCEETRRVQATLRQGSTAPELSGAASGTLLRQIGKYQPKRELGRGSMGVVYEARCVETDRKVALKVLAFNLAVSARSVQRFRREMSAARKLRHPGIVEVLEVGEDNGLGYIAMEFIEGPSLAQLLEEAAAARKAGRPDDLELPGENGGSPVGRAVRIVVQVAEALEQAHRQGIIHRDIKPANILVDGDGRPRLLDFGLAKDLSELSISSTGDLAGTPCYMSPEQAMSKRIKVDHRSDIFSLGVVFYELLGRNRPFGGETLQRLFFEISFKDPEPLRRLNPRLPRDVITICEKAMAKDPDHRFQSAAEMAGDLRRFLNHESIVARPVGAVQRWVRRARHQPGIAAVGVVLLVCAFALPILLWWWGRRERLVLAMESVQPFLAVEAYRREDLQSAWDALRVEERLRALDPDPGSAEGRALAELERKRLALADAMDEFVTAPASPEDSWMSPQSWTARAAAYRLMAPLLRDGKLEERQNVDAFMSTLKVASEPSGAEVHLRALSRIDGRKLEKQYVGTTPVTDYAFEPGLFRIVVSLEGYETAELTRRLDDPGLPYELHVVLRSSEDAFDDMVRIKGGKFVFGEGPEANWPIHERELEIDGFWVDVDEVSNAEYRAFVEATGAPAPVCWPVPYDPETWDDRPVVTVGLADAQAFAEWAGKRLPTAAEWQRTARGSDGYLYPGGEESPDPSRYAICRTGNDENQEGVDDLERARREFLSAVDPVDRPDTPANREGVKHTLGNVSEWSEGCFPMRDSAGRIYTRDGQVQVMGSCWWMDVSQNLADVSTSPPNAADFSIGFRCVKSINP